MVWERWKALSLSAKILLALAGGLVFGLLLNTLEGAAPGAVHWVAQTLLGTIGRLFLASLQLLVVPLVFVSLVVGTSSLSDPAKLGRLGIGTLAFYLVTTGIAVTLALSAASLIQPGSGIQMAAASDYAVAKPPPVSDVLVNIIPTNPVRALTDGNMLQIIVFAVLFGLGIVMAGAGGQRVRGQFEAWNEVIMQIVNIVMVFAPLGVFALIARVAAELGLSSLLPLMAYFLTVLGVLLVHMLIVYPLLLKLLTGLNPLTFLKKMRSVMLFAFSTASSNATIPVNLRTAEEALGVPKKVASFTIPLGATINMDGTAIMQGVAVVFIAQVYGVDLTLVQLGTVVAMAVLASIGTAGVPGVGLVMLATVLTQVGLPVEGISLIIGIDRLLDMARTAVNVTGDATVSTVMAKREGVLDEARFNDPQAAVQCDEAGQPSLQQAA